MSEITRGVPEEVQGRAKIIDFEAAKGKRLEEKNRQAQWLQEREKQTIKPVDATSPAFPHAIIERDQKPHPEQQRGIIPAETHKGERQPPAEIPNPIIDFQTARENRRINQQEDYPVNSETPTFLKPDSINSKEHVVNDPDKTPDNNPDDVDRYKDEDKPKDTNESDQLTREKQQIKAMEVIGTKLAQFDVPMQKRNEIFDSLADDPKGIVKIAGILKNIHPQDSIAILENIADFRKRIDQALENKAAQENEEAEQELSGFDLLCLILGEFLKGAANAVVGDELEQIGLKETEEKSA